MKKYTWLMALVVALALVFVACDDGSGKTKPPNTDLPTVEIAGADITLYAVGETAQLPVIDGNKVKYGGTVPGVTSSGFGYDFPDSVLGKGYGTITVEMKIISIDTPSFISFNAKDDKNIQNDVLIVGHTQQYHNELKIGTVTDKEVSAACGKDVCLIYTVSTSTVGATGSASYPMNKLTKGRIVFQYNPWADDIKLDTDYASWTPAAGTPKFEIEVTKITFPGGKPEEPEPPAPPPPAGTTLLDLTTWLAAGDVTDLPSGLVKAGNPTLAITDGKLVVSNRVNGTPPQAEDWVSVDISKSLFVADTNYTITATGSLDIAGKIKLAQAGSPYGTLVDQTLAAAGAFTLTKDFTLADLTGVVGGSGADKDDPATYNIRLQTEGAAAAVITIDNIVVKTK